MSRVMSEMGERGYIDLECLEGLDGTLLESLLGDSSLLGELSSRIGSQIDRRCCSRTVPNALGPAAELEPACGRSAPPPPSESRPIALAGLSAAARPRSSAHPDQRACIVRRNMCSRPPSVDSNCDDPLCRDCFAFECELSPRSSRQQAANEQSQGSAGTRRTVQASIVGHLMYSSLLSPPTSVSVNAEYIYRVPLPIAT
ncbi:hypothetical protein C8Q74DRAFT_717246 [Fomes fomentarius]|nr:hypothetical protein C8Q74DRAFT_717246 [Fomes fomentarius]